MDNFQFAVNKIGDDNWDIHIPNRELNRYKNTDLWKECTSLVSQNEFYQVFFLVKKDEAPKNAEA